MFLATESISEIPVEHREKFLRLVEDFDLFLLSYSSVYREADNASYFKDWRQNFGDHVAWHETSITQMPGFRYLFGKRTDSETNKASSRP